MPIISANQQQPSNEPESTMPEGRRQRGTGFTNIGRILGANIGAGQQMGQQVGQALGLQAGQVRAGAERSAQQFRTQAEEARSKALQDISGVGQFLGATPASVPQGLAGLSEEQAKTAGEKLRGAKYAGPSKMMGAEGLQKKAGTLGEAAIYGYGGPGGQRQLLRQAVAAPGTYTSGQSILDQILLGQSAAGQRAVRGGAQEALGTKQAIGGLLGTTAQRAKDIESEVGKEKERVGKGALEYLSGIQEQATKQGEQFASETRRANELLADPTQFGMKMDPNLGRVYDPIKAEEDKRIMTTLGQRGLGTGVLVDPSQSDYLTTVLQGLATGETNINAPYYQGPQQEAARNLALMTGQTDLAKTIQETSPFRTAVFAGEEDIKKGQTYQDMMNAIPEPVSQNIDLQSKGQYLLNALNNNTSDFGKLPNYKEIYEQVTGRDLNIPRDKVEGMRVLLETGLYRLKEQEKALRNEFLSKRMTLQDYLNQMFGTVYTSDPTKGITMGELPQRTGPRQV
jgi:hypothetical protein